MASTLKARRQRIGLQSREGPPPLPMAAAALRWRRWGYGPLAVLVALLAVQLTHAADAPCATAPEAAERHRFYTRIFIEDTDLNGTSAPMPEDARVERCVRA